MRRYLISQILTTTSGASICFLGPCLLARALANQAKVVATVPPHGPRFHPLTGQNANQIQAQGQMAHIATPGESETYRRRIDTTDQATDALVHELYGLTEGDGGHFGRQA